MNNKHIIFAIAVVLGALVIVGYTLYFPITSSNVTGAPRDVLTINSSGVGDGTGASGDTSIPSTVQSTPVGSNVEPSKEPTTHNTTPVPVKPGYWVPDTNNPSQDVWVK